jgi:uncharacterized protein YajQ (UPF0234 family)
MCADPITIGTVVSMAGSVVQGVQGMQAGKANAASLNQQARNREEKAKFDIEQTTRDFTRKQGKTLAVIGGSGVDSRSFSDILADDIAEKNLAVAAIKTGAQADASNLRSQASAAKSQGMGAMIGGLFGAASAGAAGYAKVNKINTAYQVKGISVNNSEFGE